MRLRLQSWAQGKGTLDKSTMDNWFAEEARKERTQSGWCGC